MSELTPEDFAGSIVSRFGTARKINSGTNQLKDLEYEGWVIGKAMATKTYEDFRRGTSFTLDVKLSVSFDENDPSNLFELSIEELGISRRFATLIDVRNFIYGYEPQVDKFLSS